MEWFTYEHGQALVPKQLMRNLVPQALAVVAEVQILAKDIPIRPELIPAEYGPPAPMQQWSGRIGNRLLTVECEATDSPHESVLIQTCFLPDQDEFGDWVVLLELQALPKSIIITRPLFIESRNAHPKCVVYRPESQGWNTPIYKAASLIEADNLLTFMQQDTWNDRCFIGDPEPAGKWVIIQGDRVMVGYGSELHAALRFACEWSLRYAPVALLVKDVSGASNDTYVISQGCVKRQ